MTSNYCMYSVCSINIRVKKGELVAVVGAVGSGKSSFVSALIGETEKLSGSVNILVRISTIYCSQLKQHINHCVVALLFVSLLL